MRGTRRGRLLTTKVSTRRSFSSDQEQLRKETHQTTIKQTAHGRYLAQAILASDVQVPVGDLKLGELDDLLGREDGELERLDALGGV